MSGCPLFCCWRLASLASIFIPVEAGGGGNEGLGARERERGGETLLLGEGDLDHLSCVGEERGTHRVVKVMFS